MLSPGGGQVGLGPLVPKASHTHAVSRDMEGIAMVWG